MKNYQNTQTNNTDVDLAAHAETMLETDTQSDDNESIDSNTGTTTLPIDELIAFPEPLEYDGEYSDHYMDDISGEHVDGETSDSGNDEEEHNESVGDPGEYESGDADDPADSDHQDDDDHDHDHGHGHGQGHGYGHYDHGQGHGYGHDKGHGDEQPDDLDHDEDTELDDAPEHNEEIELGDAPVHDENLELGDSPEHGDAPEHDESLELGDSPEHGEELVLNDDNLNDSESNDFFFFAGTIADFVIQRIGDSVVITDQFGVERVENVDAQEGIERLQFSDVNVAFDLDSNDSAGMTAQLLCAAFGNDAVFNKDYAGVGIGLFDSGQSMEQVAQLAIETGLISGPNNSDFVSEVWFNLIGSTIDSDNLNYFTQQLDDQVMTQASLLASASQSDLANTAIETLGINEFGLEYSV